MLNADFGAISQSYSPFYKEVRKKKKNYSTCSTYFYRALRKRHRNIIHVNLAVSMLLAQVLFLLGVDQTRDKVRVAITGVEDHRKWYHKIVQFSPFPDNENK